MFDCILLIAGKSTRFQNKINKVFYKIRGKSIYRYSLEKFLSMKECYRVVLVVSEDFKDQLISEIQDLPQDRMIITIGGAERQDSVFQGLLHTDRDYVLIHDGARPLVTTEQIKKVYQATVEHKAALLAMKIPDTVKEVEDGKVKTLDRELLWAAQTPQGVHREMFVKAMEKAQRDDFYGTDDVVLMEKYHRIYPRMILGSEHNRKITSKEDLQYLRYIVGRNIWK